MSKRDQQTQNPQITSQILKAVFDQNPAPTWVADCDGTMVDINPSCCAMMNIQPDEVIGKYNVFQDTIIQEQQLRPLVKSVFKEGKTAEYTIKYDSAKLSSIELKNTRSLTLYVIAAPITDEAGNTVGAVFVHHDITKNMLIENELSFFKNIVENSSDAVFWLKKNGQFAYVNQQACQSLGYSKRELENLHLWDIDPDYPLERWAQNWDKTAKAGRLQLESKHRRKDGSIFPVEIATLYLVHETDEFHVAFARDISSRKRAQKELAESEANLREAQEMAQLGYWSWDIDSGAVEWSEQVYRIFHLDPAQFTPQIDSIMALSPWPEENERHREIIKAAIEKKEQGHYEQRFLRPDGSTGYYFSTFHGIFDENNKLITMVGTVQDITERKKTEEELRTSEQKYRSLVDNLGTGITLIGKGMKVQSVNTVVKSRFPHVDFSTRPICYKTFNTPPRDEPCSYCAALKTFQDGQVHETVTETPTTDGIKHFRIVTSPIKDDNDEVTAVIEMVDDITERINFEQEKEKLEKQLQQAQKMEAVGTLAGGIAHDFNNMLGVIIGYTELLKNKLSTDSPLLRYTREIEKAALRSRDTTRQLLGFSRQQEISPKTLDLVKHIKQLKLTLSRLIGEDIGLFVRISPDLWNIFCDPSQVDQILINLAINARDAMPNGGELTIEAENTTLDEEFCLHHFAAEPGNYIQLKISDNGTGMDEETASHAFDPFFTTKAIGKGTGLGLATVYGIVKQNNGLIYIQSEPGQGTTFTIYLQKPKIQKVAEAPPKNNERPHTPLSGSILLVEDDEMVRNMVQQTLEDLGYDVIVAQTPESALKICQGEEEISLMLTDVIMPKMNGAELRDEVLAICPTMKIIFMSGYSATVISKHGVLENDVNFIQKPFNQHEIAEKIELALGESGAK